MKCITFYMRRKNDEVRSVCSKSPKTSEIIWWASDKHMVYIVRHREKRNACVLENLLSNISNKKNNNLLIRSFISKKIKRYCMMSTGFFPVFSLWLYVMHYRFQTYWMLRESLMMYCFVWLTLEKCHQLGLVLKFK